MSAEDKLNFQKDERILCFHGPLIYEAKILKAELWKAEDYGAEEGPHYFVHYKGWKQSWDEWVPESRVLKFNEVNLQRQKDLQVAYARKKEPAVSSADGNPVAKSSQSQQQQQQQSSGSGNSGGGGPGRKRTIRDITNDREEDYLKRPEICIPLPDSLKAQLVDDWENVTRGQRLVALPRQPTVTQFLDDYRASKLGKSGSRGGKNAAAQDDMLDEVIAGLKQYFDKALGNILLYRYERQQYANIRKQHPDKPMSEIYGCEHLLRLFVQLPMLIAHTTMDHESVLLLKEQMAGIIGYMQKSSSKVFMKEYENAPPEYLHALQN